MIRPGSVYVVELCHLVRLVTKPYNKIIIDRTITQLRWELCTNQEPQSYNYDGLPRLRKF